MTPEYEDKNMAKLLKRYQGKYSDKKAQDRADKEPGLAGEQTSEAVWQPLLNHYFIT